MNVLGPEVRMNVLGPEVRMNVLGLEEAVDDGNDRMMVRLWG
jgi:hypothetical protein